MIHIAVEPTQLIVNQINTVSVIFSNLDDKPCTRISFRLRLPTQITLLDGTDQIYMEQINSHENITHTVRVRPKEIGSWIIGSSSFSYRDSQGQSRHPVPLQQMVDVVQAVAIPELLESKISVELHTKSLPLKEWGQLECDVINCGSIAIYNVSFKILGPVALDGFNSQDILGVLMPGEHKKIQVLARADESGNKVPFHFEVAYYDKMGKNRHYDQLIPIQVVTRNEAVTIQLGETHDENNIPIKKIATSTPKIFISYSHSDEKHMKRLEAMLKPLEKQGVLAIWNDRGITAGNEWYQDIRNTINTCDLALLLISVDFLNSRFIQEDELPRLLHLRKEKGLRIVPIILRDCMWTSVPILKDLQALPKDGRAVISFKGSGQPDRIWSEIAKSIEELIKIV